MVRILSERTIHRYNAQQLAIWIHDASKKFDVLPESSAVVHPYSCSIEGPGISKYNRDRGGYDWVCYISVYQIDKIRDVVRDLNKRLKKKKLYNL